MLVVLVTKPILVANWSFCARVKYEPNVMSSSADDVGREVQREMLHNFSLLESEFRALFRTLLPPNSWARMATLRALSAGGRVRHLHLRSLLSNFSLSRHDRLANFSDTLQRHHTNTRVRSTNSVFISTPVTAHSRTLVCWIDSQFFRRFSSAQFGKCSGTDKSQSEKLLSVRAVLLKASRMVWITDLDNPKVNWSGKFWRDDLDTGGSWVVCLFCGRTIDQKCSLLETLAKALATRLLINTNGKRSPLDKDTSCFHLGSENPRKL